MWKMVLTAVLGMMVLNGGVVHAAKPCDDMSWWGNTGAKPEPTVDGKGRAGCWWCPQEAAKNDGDGELWGNRGVVFHAWKKPVKETKLVVPPKGEVGRHGHPHLFLDIILFDFGKAVLRPEGKAATDKVIVELRKHGSDTVEIEGHASSEGDEAYNNALGLRRAEAVKRYMVDSGIAPERITAVSYGETKPAFPENTPINKKLNRRVEFKLQVVN